MIITERVDDVPLLIGQMVTMGLPEVLDRHIPRHWTQRGLSWGWTAVIWLASILTEGDHRKVSVEAYIKGMHNTLSHLSGQPIEPLDCSDDRLGHLLTHLSKPTYWQAIEPDLHAWSIEVSDLPQDVIRCDATTVSGAHAVTDGGLVQCGHSNDDPTRPQITTQAEHKLAALTPARGRGTRQIHDEATLVEAIDHVLKEQRVDGLLRIEWEPHIERHTHYVGRGRGSAKRAQRVTETTRSHITRITRQEDAIVALVRRCGWKACVTNAAPQRLSLAAAVLCSRHAYHIERIFNRLKSRVHIAPLFVARDDHIEGLTSLLTLGVRVLTVLEFVLRRSLQNDQAHLPGLHPAHGKKMTDTPTAEQILKAFPGVSLSILKTAAGEEILRWLTPLSVLQQEILHRLGLAVSLYRQLEIQHSSN